MTAVSASQSSPTSSATACKSSCSPLILYNRAVIYFHRQMNQSASQSIETLVDKLDTLNDNLATSVGALNIRLLLSMQQFKKALAYLHYLLKRLNTTIPALVAQDSTVQDVLPRLEPTVFANLKLLTMLTLVVNRNIVVIPEDKVSMNGQGQRVRVDAT